MSLKNMSACEPRAIGPSTPAVKSAAYPPTLHGEGKSVYVGSRVYKLEEPIRRSWQFLQWLISAPVRLLDTFLPIMLPTSPLRKAWAIWTLVLVLFVAFDVPLRIAFQSWKQLHIIHTLSLMTSANFCLDVIVHFRTAFITDQGDMIRDARLVARDYLFGMFSFDVLSALPLTDILIGSRFQRNAAWLGLLKLPRLFTLVRHMDDLTRTKYANLVSVARLLGAMLLVTHWAACLWIFMSAENSSWPSMISEECRNCPDTHKYLLAFYRSFLMLLGDRPDTFNNLERIFSVVLLSLGACIYAVVVSSITMLVSDMWSMASRHKQRAAMLQDVLRYKGADDDVRVRVDDYYDFMATFGHPGSDGVSILSELPSTLHAETLSSIFEPLLVKVQLFAFCERPFLWRLAQRLRLSVFMAGDTIYNVGSVGHDMYLIWKGAVGLLEPDGSMAALLCEKDHFGELSLMVANTPRPHRAVALRQCDIMMLSRWDLQDAIRDFPDSAKLVKQRARIGLEDHEATPAVWAATLAAKQVRQPEELRPPGESRRLLGSAAVERWQADTIKNDPSISSSRSSSDMSCDDTRFGSSSSVRRGRSAAADTADGAQGENRWGLRQRRPRPQPVGEATEQSAGELLREPPQSSKPLPRSVLRRQQSQDLDVSFSPGTRGQTAFAADEQLTRTAMHYSAFSSSPTLRNDQQQVQLLTLQRRRPQDTSRKGGLQDTSRRGGLQDSSRWGLAWDSSTSGRRPVGTNVDTTVQPETETCVPLNMSEASTHRGHLSVVTSVSSPNCKPTGPAGGKIDDRSDGSSIVRPVLRSISGDNLLGTLARRESSAPSLLILQPQPFLGLDPLGPLYDSAAKSTGTNGAGSQRRYHLGSPTVRRKRVRRMSASYVGENSHKRLADIATLYGRLAYGRLEGLQGPCYNPGCVLLEQELRDTRADLQEARAQLEHAKAELGEARAQIESMQRKPLQISVLAAAFRSEVQRVVAKLDAHMAKVLKQLLDQVQGVGVCADDLARQMESADDRLQRLEAELDSGYDTGFSCPSAVIDFVPSPVLVGMPHLDFQQLQSLRHETPLVQQLAHQHIQAQVGSPLGANLELLLPLSAHSVSVSGAVAGRSAQDESRFPLSKLISQKFKSRRHSSIDALSDSEPLNAGLCTTVSSIDDPLGFAPEGAEDVDVSPGLSAHDAALIAAGMHRALRSTINRRRGCSVGLSLLSLGGGGSVTPAPAGVGATAAASADTSPLPATWQDGQMLPGSVDMATDMSTAEPAAGGQSPLLTVVPQVPSAMEGNRAPVVPPSSSAALQAAERRYLNRSHTTRTGRQERFRLSQLESAAAAAAAGAGAGDPDVDLQTTSSANGSNGSNDGAEDRRLMLSVQSEIQPILPTEIFDEQQQRDLERGRSSGELRTNCLKSNIRGTGPPSMAPPCSPVSAFSQRSVERTGRSAWFRLSTALFKGDGQGGGQSPGQPAHLTRVQTMSKAEVRSALERILQ